MPGEVLGFILFRRFLDRRRRGHVGVRSSDCAARSSKDETTFVYVSVFCADELVHPTTLPFSIGCGVFVFG